MNNTQFAEVIVKIAKEFVGEKRVAASVKSISDVMAEFDNIHDKVINMEEQKEQLERDKWKLIKESDFVKDFRELAVEMEKELDNTAKRLEKKYGIILHIDSRIRPNDDTYLHSTIFLRTKENKEFGLISFSMILENYGKDSYSNEKLVPKIDGNMHSWNRNPEEKFVMKEDLDEDNTLFAWKSFLEEVELNMIPPNSKDASKKASSFNVNEMLKHYLIAALWSSTDDDGEPLDNNYDKNDLDREVVRKSLKDCKAFAKAAEMEYGEDFTKLDEKQVGHDLWLTRNGHGAGFWDGDYDEDLHMGETFTDMSKSLGEVNLYVGDDGKIYLM